MMSVICHCRYTQHCAELLQAALHRMDMGLRPHTTRQYQRQFRLFLAFAISRSLTCSDSPSLILLFLEFLASHSLSYRVILNYISVMKHMFLRTALDCSVIRRMLNGIKLLVRHQPLPKSVFTLQQIKQIAVLCDSFPYPQGYRSAFLLAFYAFPPPPPPFQKSFDPSRHLL